jgi:DNA-binding NarL/FixJ family response regulator
MVGKNTTAAARSESRGLILVVEDEFLVARVVSLWVLAEGWSVHVTETVKSSLVALGEPLSGAVIDLALPDGSGFDIIEAARSRRHDVPFLIMTGSHDPENINRAQILGVEYACKPACADSVSCFLDRCWAANPKRVSKLVGDVAIRHRLTPAHSRLVRAAVECTTRDELCKKLNVSPNTVKAQVQEILVRTGASSLHELIAPMQVARRGS